MSIAIPNTKCFVVRGSDGSTIVPTPGSANATVKANMQKVGAESMPVEYSGFEIERRPTHRIRIDRPVKLDDPTQSSGVIPTEGDTVIVTEFSKAPELLGRWQILKVEGDTGLLASLLLFVKRPDLSN